MFGKILAIEFRLRMREVLTPAFAVALPLALLFGFGLMPDATKPAKDLGGESLAEYMAVLGTGIAFAILSLMMLPGVLSDYRERGVLRRMRATPVRPSALLTAQLVINAGAGAVTAAIMIGVGAAAFGTPAPRGFGWFLLAAALCLWELLAIGSLITAVSPNARAGNAIGSVLFFPSMFFAGVYFPYDKMPHTLQRICDCTPLGAGIRTMRDAWLGHAPHPYQLVIMAGYAVVATAAAARLFRWE
ncbi:ABC transporter permease [Actinomadura sp. LD22]|uniref:Transport permease protein n=1 Tax=Actinomadura physcomitrii TaxID=2650748 RepID=A0A6I4MC18_9ACTN|nr:ABC transporter permease [Actinomadura physcomitrii]MWA01794.1 ABC transporter permease [Actinomadura physcomitrii]